MAYTTTTDFRDYSTPLRTSPEGDDETSGEEQPEPMPPAEPRQ